MRTTFTGPMGRPESRALTSADPWLPAEAVVHEIRRETHNILSYTLAFKEPIIQRKYAFRPGQFNMLGFPGIGEAPISLSSDPANRSSFMQTFRIVGDVTKALARLQPGDTVGVRGPFGNPWPMNESRGSDLLFIGGGSGIASLRSAIEVALRQRSDYGRVILLYGAKTPRDLLFTADFGRWSSHLDVDLLLSVDRTDGLEWHHHIGVVPALLDEVEIALESTTVFLCGPEVMMHLVLNNLQKKGVPDRRIFLSMERRVRCGVAQCGHCFLGPKFVCQDGPIFRYSEIRDLLGKGI